MLNQTRQTYFKPTWLIGCLILGLILSAGFFARMVFVLFGPVQNIQTNGVLHDSTQVGLQKILTRYFERPRLDRYFLFFRASDIRAEILKLPWVSGCRIEKKYPKTIQIQIQERRPIAWWGESAVLDDTGVIFKPEPLTHFKKLPRFESGNQTDVALKMLDYYQKIHHILNHADPASLMISTLQYSKSGIWTIMLENGIKLISNEKYTVSKLEQFVLAYHKHLKFKATQIRSVDFRYANGFAIAWKSNQNEVNPAEKLRTGGCRYVQT